jgi:Small metal-binding protein
VFWGIKPDARQASASKHDAIQLTEFGPKRRPLRRRRPNPHAEAAIKHLEQATDEGKEGNADVATTDAEAALTHLEQVQ